MKMAYRLISHLCHYWARCIDSYFPKIHGYNEPHKECLQSCYLHCCLSFTCFLLSFTFRCTLTLFVASISEETQYCAIFHEIVNHLFCLRPKFLHIWNDIPSLNSIKSCIWNKIQFQTFGKQGQFAYRCAYHIVYDKEKTSEDC